MGLSPLAQGRTSDFFGLDWVTVYPFLLQGYFGRKLKADESLVVQEGKAMFGEEKKEEAENASLLFQWICEKVNCFWVCG